MVPGPNSSPNGDTRIVMGHVNEEFVCTLHGPKHLAWCNETVSGLMDGRFTYPKCRVVSLRQHLALRGHLVTGKTS